MNPLQFLPKELEDIIIDYKTQMETYTKYEKFFILSIETINDNFNDMEEEEIKDILEKYQENREEIINILMITGKLGADIQIFSFEYGIEIDLDMKTFNDNYKEIKKSLLTTSLEDIYINNWNCEGECDIEFAVYTIHNSCKCKEATKHIELI